MIEFIGIRNLDLPPTSKKPLVSDPGMHHGTCLTIVPWVMSGWPTRGSVSDKKPMSGTEITVEDEWVAILI